MGKIKEKGRHEDKTEGERKEERHKGKRRRNVLERVERRREGEGKSVNNRRLKKMKQQKTEERDTSSERGEGGRKVTAWNAKRQGNLEWNGMEWSGVCEEEREHG